MDHRYPTGCEFFFEPSLASSLTQLALQVIKSRIQSATTGTYSGFLDCARKTIAADGVGALWRGLGPAMSRAFPANAAAFVGSFDTIH